VLLLLRVFLFGESTTKKNKKKTKCTHEKKSKKNNKHHKTQRENENNSELSLSLSPLFFYPQKSSKKAQLPPKPPLSER